MRCRALHILFLPFALAACSIRLAWPEQPVKLRVVGEEVDHLGLTTDTGAEIELRDATLGLDAVELIPCEPDVLDAVASQLAPVSVAFAHGIDTPTRSARPTVFDVITEPSRDLATLLPPQGEYCGVRVELGPMDEDAVGLTPEMHGRTFVLRGRTREPDGDWEEFQLLADRKAACSSSAQLDVGGDAHIRDVQIRFDIERWFEGVQAADLVSDSEEARRAVLLNIRESVVIQ